jgi:lambda repressor-like predicted transcriptional regulator
MPCASEQRRGADHPSQRDELIATLYATGIPIAEIAAETGVCSKTVRNVARRLGLPPRNPPQPLRDASVVARYRAGDRVSRIATTHGISRSRVRIIAERAGVPARAGWQRRYPIDESAFDQPTDVGWWLIGLLAADGSIHAQEHRVSLCQTLEDSDVLRAFYRYVGCPDRPLTMLNLSEAARMRQLPRRPAGEARVFSRRLVSALASHGVVPQKTSSMKLGRKASTKAPVWLGVLDGDGSVGIYRNGRAPRIMFAGTSELMKQCEEFWRNELGFTTARPAARPHSRSIWTFTLWGSKAALAARTLLSSSPVSMRRKRALLLQIAAWS